MKLFLTKTATVLLLTAFLATGLGNMFGCVWCDSGCLSSTHINSHLDDHRDRHVDVHTTYLADIHVDVSVKGHTLSLDQHVSDKSDSCLDSSIQLDDGARKDNVLIKGQPASVAIPAGIARIVINKDSLLVSKVISGPPRTSQSILTHRTIVLLS